MKRIGVFCGADAVFPYSLIEYINSQGKNVEAELVKIGTFKIQDKLKYDLIFDRVSRSVPMYQAILKAITSDGVIVINNPFINCLEDYFFQLYVARQMGYNVPETVILPTKEHPVGTTSDTFKNLVYPLDWSNLFDYVGFPLYLRVNLLSSEHFTYKVYNPSEFFSAYDASGTRQMVVQKCYEFTNYYRAFVIGKRFVKIFHYDIDKPLISRYSRGSSGINPSHKKEIETISTNLCSNLDIDFTTIDFGVFDNRIYIVNFYNSTPKIDNSIFGEDDYKWFIFTTGDFLINLVENSKEYLRNSKWLQVLKKK